MRETRRAEMFFGAPPIIFYYARQLRKNATPTERKLWSVLKRSRFKFRRQHPVYLYIVDFYCHEIRLSIEIDGGYHLRKAQRELDDHRTNQLKDYGITEIRFTNDEIMSDFSTVLKTIDREIEYREQLLLVEKNRPRPL